MIAIKVEIWPYGDKTKAKTIGRMYIANDGTGSRFEGDYNIKITDGAEEELKGGFEFHGLETPLKGRVEHHDRKLGFWPIVERAIASIIQGETDGK